MSRLTQRRRVRLLSALVGLLLLALGSQCGPRSRVYGLTADSTYQEGCFAPLDCPVRIAEDLGGTFRLERRPPHPAQFEVYAVRDVFWLVRLGDEDIPITGLGSYWLGGEFGFQQRLELELRVGDAEPRVFDSGLVPLGDPGFPEIDVTISLHGGTAFDMVIGVVAVPFPPRAPAPPTPCGPLLSCDHATEICVGKTPIGPAVVYSCEPIPAGCQAERSCACAGAALCPSPFDVCQEFAENSLECECLQCQ